MLLQHPIINMHHAPMRHAATPIGASPHRRPVPGRPAGDRRRQPDAVAVERAPPRGADMIKEPIVHGLPEEELLTDAGRNVELPGPEKVEEDREALRVAIDEVLGRGAMREVPLLVQESAEHRIPAGVSEGCRGCFKDFSAHVEPDSIGSSARHLFEEFCEREKGEILGSDTDERRDFERWVLNPYGEFRGKRGELGSNLKEMRDLEMWVFEEREDFVWIW